MASVVGVTAHKAGKNAAQTQQRESSQEQRLAELEAQQQQQAAPPPAPAPPAAAPPAAAPGGGDIVGELTKLKGLMDAGVLTPAEFDAAKAKLLAG